MHVCFFFFFFFFSFSCFFFVLFGVFGKWLFAVVHALLNLMGRVVMGSDLCGFLVCCLSVSSFDSSFFFFYHGVLV